MNRNTYAERDERGRFVSDDDDDRRRYSRSERDDDDRRSSRSRDERGRFESDDDRRSSSRRRDGDDDRRSSGGGRGWFGDSEGHSQAVRSRDDDVGARQLGSFATVQAIPLCIPFKAGTKSDASACGDSNLPAPDSLLVKVTTDQGLVRWGEAFGFRAVMSGVFYIGLGQTSMTSKRKSGTGVGSGRASTTT